MIERIYTINVRKKVVKTARYKRAKKAVKLVREFLMRHMKSKDVKIDKEINEKIWSRGIKNPVTRIKVRAIKDDAGKVTATLLKE